MEPTDLALLVVRIMFGVGLCFHGYNKLFDGGGLAGTGRWFASIAAVLGVGGAMTQLAVCYRPAR